MNHRVFTIHIWLLTAKAERCIKDLYSWRWCWRL